jgi:hypothetical protein
MLKANRALLTTLAFRFLWQWYPSLWTCALFWLVVAAVEFWMIRSGEIKMNWRKNVIWAGAAMNAAVTLANDGRMPVLGKFAPMSLWVVGTGKRLLFLCDRFNGGWAIFSLGDFFIIAGVVVLPLLLWLVRLLFKSKNPLK